MTNNTSMCAKQSKIFLSGVFCYTNCLMDIHLSCFSSCNKNKWCVCSGIVCWTLQNRGSIFGKSQHNSEKCCLCSSGVLYMESACFIYTVYSIAVIPSLGLRTPKRVTRRPQSSIHTWKISSKLCCFLMNYWKLLYPPCWDCSGFKGHNLQKSVIMTLRCK